MKRRVFEKKNSCNKNLEVKGVLVAVELLLVDAEAREKAKLLALTAAGGEAPLPQLRRHVRGQLVVRAVRDGRQRLRLRLWLRPRSRSRLRLPMREGDEGYALAGGAILVRAVHDRRRLVLHVPVEELPLVVASRSVTVTVAVTVAVAVMVMVTVTVTVTWLWQSISAAPPPVLTCSRLRGAGAGAVTVAATATATVTVCAAPPPVCTVGAQCVRGEVKRGVEGACTSHAPAESAVLQRLRECE